MKKIVLKPVSNEDLKKFTEERNSDDLGRCTDDLGRCTDDLGRCSDDLGRC